MKIATTFSEFLLLSVLLASCFSSLVGATTTHPDEVQALEDIAKTLDKNDWDFDIDPCSGNPNWTTFTTPSDDSAFKNNVYCNCSIVDDKFCHVVGMFTGVIGFKVCNGSIWWNDLMKVCEMGLQGGWFQNKIARFLGEGKEVYFWEDKWLQDTKLAEEFSRLYAISLQKQCSVAQMGSWNGLEWEWDLTWRRSLFLWENEMLDGLKRKISEGVPRKGVQDIWSWAGDHLEGYTVGKTYTQRLNMDLVESDTVLFKWIWRLPIPSKIAAFVWKLSLDRIQTKQNLFRRNILGNINDANCPFCAREIETANHLFFTCRFSYSIWSQCYAWAGLQMPLPSSCKEHFLQHVGLLHKESQRKAWWCVWMAMIWSLWKHRNDVIFNQSTPDSQKVMDSMHFFSWSWLNAKCNNFNYSFYAWLMFPLLCLS